MISFKGAHFPKDVTLYAFFYVRYAVSYRDLEEIMEEGALMWVIPHSIIGLSTIHPPWLWKLKN
jgi:transposase-like protein